MTILCLDLTENAERNALADDVKKNYVSEFFIPALTQKMAVSFFRGKVIIFSVPKVFKNQKRFFCVFSISYF